MSEELVLIGLELERLERPKAEARQAEGQGRGRESRWSGSVSAETEPKQETRTAAVVGEALGISRSNYHRAKHVVQTANGEIELLQQAEQHITATFNRREAIAAD